MLIMLSGEKSLEMKGVSVGEAACDYSAVNSFHILECHRRGTSQEPRRGTCEISGRMKDLYRYRKGAISWKGLRR